MRVLVYLVALQAVFSALGHVALGAPKKRSSRISQSRSGSRHDQEEPSGLRPSDDEVGVSPAGSDAPAAAASQEDWTDVGDVQHFAQSLNPVVLSAKASTQTHVAGEPLQRSIGVTLTRDILYVRCYVDATRQQCTARGPYDSTPVPRAMTRVILPANVERTYRGSSEYYESAGRGGYFSTADTIRQCCDINVLIAAPHVHACHPACASLDGSFDSPETSVPVREFDMERDLQIFEDSLSFSQLGLQRAAQRMVDAQVRAILQGTAKARRTALAEAVDDLQVNMQAERIRLTLGGNKRMTPHDANLARFWFEEYRATEYAGGIGGALAADWADHFDGRAPPPGLSRAELKSKTTSLDLAVPKKLRPAGLSQRGGLVYGGALTIVREMEECNRSKQAKEFKDRLKAGRIFQCDEEYDLEQGQMLYQVLKYTARVVIQIQMTAQERVHAGFVKFGVGAQDLPDEVVSRFGQLMEFRAIFLTRGQCVAQVTKPGFVAHPGPMAQSWERTIQIQLNEIRGLEKEFDDAYTKFLSRLDMQRKKSARKDPEGRKATPGERTGAGPAAVQGILGDDAFDSTITEHVKNACEVLEISPGQLVGVDAEATITSAAHRATVSCAAQGCEKEKQGGVRCVCVCVWSANRMEWGGGRSSKSGTFLEHDRYNVLLPKSDWIADLYSRIPLSRVPLHESNIGLLMLTRSCMFATDRWQPTRGRENGSGGKVPVQELPTSVGASPR